MTPTLKNELLADRLSTIERDLARITNQSDAQAVAEEICAALLDVLDLVARDPGIDAAVDDLYRSVLAFVEAGEDSISARRRRLLGEAHARLQQRLAA